MWRKTLISMKEPAFFLPWPDKPVHSSDSFTLSFFLFSSCSAMARNCLGRRTTRVLFRPYLDVDVSTICSTGLSLISINSLDDVDNVSEPTILSFPLHHFLSPKLKFLHAVGSLSPCLIRSCWRYVLYICHLLWLLPLKHDYMTYQVQIKFMKFQRRYLVRIIQLLSFNVVVILFQRCVFCLSLSVLRFSLRILIWARWSTWSFMNVCGTIQFQRKFSFCLVVSWI